MSQHFDEVDVLAWLPSQSEAVLAGQILQDGDAASYCYDRAYLAQPDVVPLFTADLPLSDDSLHPPAPHRLAPTLRDALPDRWGRRVIAAVLSKPGLTPVREDEIDDITLMLQTGSDRIGALDFRRPNTADGRDGNAQATLEELMALADLVETGAQLPPSMHHLFAAAASVGGARPKALFTDTARNRKFIAKFSPAYDISPQRRTTRTANLAMALADGSRLAQLANAAAVAPVFGVSEPAFRRIRERLIGTFIQHWLDVCDAAGLVQSERAALAGCQFLNEFAFEGMGRTPRLR